MSSYFVRRVGLATTVICLSVSAFSNVIGAGRAHTGAQQPIVQKGASDSERAPVAGEGITKLHGAGATFPNPLYQKWFSDYNKEHPITKFDYQSIGSGGGIKQISSNAVDFGATDAPMTDAEVKAATGEVLHIPTVAGAVVVIYNVPGFGESQVNLSGKTLADIFLGNIKKWSDLKIADDNPGLALPEEDIIVVHRSDPSGTSQIFTDFLSKASSDWKQKVGAAMSVDWPAGVGAKGNTGVADQTRESPNSIGYVDFIYAAQNRLQMAGVKGPDGAAVYPSVESITAAAAAADIPADLRASITYAAAAGAYPVSAFTYVLVYRDQKNQSKGQALVNFLWWAIHDGQNAAPDMNYAPLPPDIVRMAEDKIRSITYQGERFYIESS